MAGNIDWAALPVIGEFLGIEDYDELICDLICIREHMKREQ